MRHASRGSAARLLAGLAVPLLLIAAPAPAAWAQTFTLTVNAVHGTVTKVPDQPSYASGDTVRLTAVADAFYAFSGWSGGLSGTQNPVTIAITQDTTVTAGFDPTSLVTFDVGTVTATVSPDDSCVTVPFSVTRTGSDTLRAFSVRFQLPPDLQLCTPVVSGSSTSIVEGGFLSGSGRPVSLVVTDHGDNSYTVDGSILGTKCGTTPAGGTLFTVGVTSTSTTACQAVVSITSSPVSPRMRNCDNVALPTAVGTAGTVPIDFNAPVVTLTGADTMTVECHGTFTDPGASALDACVGAVSASTGGTVNPDSVATYALVYSAGDGHGNTGTATRVVHVVDTTDPVLSGLPADILVGTGPAAVTCAALVTWTPPTASDVCAGALTPVGDHDPGTEFPVGVTTVTYTATDPSGNHASGSFTVTVVDSTLPAVALGAPNGGEVLILGTSCSITWTPATDNCAVAGVDLVLSTDGGATWPDTLARNVPNTGTYAWSVAGSPTATARVRVAARDAAGNVAASSSAGDFALEGIATVTNLAAQQVTAGNDADGTVKVRLSWDPTQTGTSVEVWRRGYGNHPEYDDPPSPGAVPPAPVSYPPPGWTLAQTVSGASTVDDEVAWPGRDFWYYVAYARTDTVVSGVSNRTGGTLGYFLGDVSDGVTLGNGDNLVDGLDLSALGAHYGITGPEVLPYGFLDVGPTASGWIDTQPITDSQIDFEDFVIFCIDWGVGTSGPMATRARPAPAAGAGRDALVLERPGRVEAGDEVSARLLLSGSGALRAVSVRLAWDPDVV
ncbi:MAG TPA: immunoglobulin-like domain-containing protein, partial [Frankiaceae bacterium]|nr:immunoglobulin-like domain-containing protein [Frankiaceae bacterium]